MRSAKVTAWLSSPLCGNPPMLDSLLEWAMGLHMSAIVRSSNGDRHARREHGGHRLIPIPIERVRLGPWLIPRASSPIFAATEETVGHVNKRPEFDPAMLDPKALRQVPVASGPYKGYRLPRRVRLVDRVVWFAVAVPRCGKSGGAASHLRSRLKDVRAIGEDTNVGYGQVQRWEVEPVEHDWSWYADAPDGPVLMRPLPVGEWLPDGLRGSRRSFGRPCGPYFDRVNACEVVTPC